MSHWSKYYQEKITSDFYIRNIYGQREFLNAIIDSGAKKILEVGAGTGTMSVFLSNMGMEVTTIDNDPKVLELAKQAKAKFGGRNYFQEADAFNLPFTDNSFDLIFHQGLLEHFADSDIHKLLTEHLRVAKIVIFSVPNSYYPKKDIGDERLLGKAKWEKILQPYKIINSSNYSLKFLPKWHLLRVPIQYMAKITKREQY